MKREIEITIDIHKDECPKALFDELERLDEKEAAELVRSIILLEYSRYSTESGGESDKNLKGWDRSDT